MVALSITCIGDHVVHEIKSQEVSFTKGGLVQLSGLYSLCVSRDTCMSTGDRWHNRVMQT